MTIISPSDAERANGHLSQESVQIGRQAILRDGFVVLRGVVDPSHCRMLRDKALEDLPRLLARTDAPFNFTRSNVQQDWPTTSPYLFRDVLVNDFAIQVTKSVLGSGLTCPFYSGNTALANTMQRQPVHADMGHLWPAQEQTNPDVMGVTPPYALVVNVILVDTDARNGSTELWPGTHLDPSCAIQDGDIKIADEVLAMRAKVAPPIQPEVKAGDILIRDIRLWHAGMPNTTDEPRPMLAMIHWVSWWMHSWRPRFAREAQPMLEHADLCWLVEFTDEEVDHVMLSHAYDVKDDD